MKIPPLSAICAALLFAIPVHAASDWEDAIGTIKQVGPEGKGNAEAAKAFQTLAGGSADMILPTLEAMDGASPLAKNWLRSAVEVVFEKEQAAGAELPSSQLQQFVLNTENTPRARELAFDLYSAIDPDGAKEMVPEMANDPSNLLRRSAVALLIEKGKILTGDGMNEEAVKVMMEALDAARDVDQIQEIAGHLRDKLEQQVDLPKHFGFLMYWNVIGPFDNTGGEGFTTAFPPEKEIDLNAKYEGKNGEVNWQEYSTSDDYGMVDFNTPYSPLKEVTSYAYTEFDSAEARAAELRLGCKNGWKIWLNGEYLFGRDEYHRGMRIDQYILPIQLKEGKNTILVKACQNEQEQDWTVEWQFQLRVCDSTGTAILSTDRKPTPEKAAPARRRSGN